ncbi:unnamed protein product [Rhizoctonia solani]|uniref:Uncharacterized protein n=1 Tax=Rhizoctonia solani TaxID=456999 RepID=A0A8H3A672_9AGAM|nr:unnamed protein product [Rhizoctonia solani]
MQHNTAALTGSKLVLFSQLKDINWHICCNKQDCKKGTCCGAHGAKQPCNPVDGKGASSNRGGKSQSKDKSPVKDKLLVKDEPPVEDKLPEGNMEPLVANSQFTESPAADDDKQPAENKEQAIDAANSQDWDPKKIQGNAAESEGEDSKAGTSNNYIPPDECTSESNSSEHEDNLASQTYAKARKSSVTANVASSLIVKKASATVNKLGTTRPTSAALQKPSGFASAFPTLKAKKAPVGKSNTITSISTIKLTTPTLASSKSGTSKASSAITATATVPVLTTKPAAGKSGITNTTPAATALVAKSTAGKTTARPNASKSSAAQSTTTKVTSNGLNPLHPSGNLKIAHSLAPAPANSSTSTVVSTKVLTLSILLPLANLFIALDSRTSSSRTNVKAKEGKDGVEYQNQVKLRPLTFDQLLSRADLDSWTEGLSEELQELRAAAANQSWKRKAENSDSAIALTFKRKARPKMRSVPEPEELAPPAETTATLPTTTRKAKAELIDDAEACIGKSTQAVQTRR